MKDLGKDLGLGCLRALVTGHVERIADSDLDAGLLAGEAPQGLHILPAIGANQRKNGLSGQPERVGDGDADTAVSDIETLMRGECWSTGGCYIAAYAKVTDGKCRPERDKLTICLFIVVPPSKDPRKR